LRFYLHAIVTSQIIELVSDLFESEIVFAKETADESLGLHALFEKIQKMN